MYHYFKRIVLDAIEEGLMRGNPCKGISVKHDRNQVTKEVLTLDEVRTLVGTHYEGEHKEVQRAFIFTLFTSTRWCDVKLLTYGNVDASTRTLRFNQKKVESRSSHSAVSFPLNDDLLALSHTTQPNLYSSCRITRPATSI